MSSNTSTLSSNPPKHYMLVLFPGFQLLDAAGPLDILRTVTFDARGAHNTLTIVSETKEPVSTAPVFPPSQAGTFDLKREAAIPVDKATGRMVVGFNPRFDADTTFDEVLSNPDKWPVDVVIIPGGFGERMTRVDKATGAESDNSGSAKRFVKTLAETNRIKNAILTVCTGSDLLAETGLLDGRRATTNMRAFDMVAAKPVCRNVKWVKGARWVRAPDPQNAAGLEIWTSAGITAGMDLTYAFISEVYGVEFARSTATKLEYDWRELKDGEIDPMYIREGIV